MSTPNSLSPSSSTNYDHSKFEVRRDCEACRIKMLLCLFEVGKPYSGCVRCSKGRNKSCIIQYPVGCKSSSPPNTRADLQPAQSSTPPETPTRPETLIRRGSGRKVIPTWTPTTVTSSQASRSRWSGTTSRRWTTTASPSPAVSLSSSLVEIAEGVELTSFCCLEKPTPLSKMPRRGLQLLVTSRRGVGTSGLDGKFPSSGDFGDRSGRELTTSLLPLDIVPITGRLRAKRTKITVTSDAGEEDEELVVSKLPLLFLGRSFFLLMRTRADLVRPARGDLDAMIRSVSEELFKRLKSEASKLADIKTEPNKNLKRSRAGSNLPSPSSGSVSKAGKGRVFVQRRPPSLSPS